MARHGIKRLPGVQGRVAWIHLPACPCARVIAHTWQAVIRLLTGRRGAASLRCPLFSRGEGAALGGSRCTEIRHQSVYSLPGPAGGDRGWYDKEQTCLGWGNGEKNKTALSDMNPPVGRKKIKRQRRQRRREHESSRGNATQWGAAEGPRWLQEQERERGKTKVLLLSGMSADRRTYDDPKIQLPSFHLSHDNER